MGVTLKILCVILSCLSLVSLTGPTAARALYNPGENPGLTPLYKTTAATPNTEYVVHNIGKIAMTITNTGQLGTGFLTSPVCDGEVCPSGEYPINSDLEYHFAGAFWIGAVVGRDTLVSVGADGWFTGINELFPDAGDAGSIVPRSTLKSRNDYNPYAVSEQDFLCTYTDTFVDPGLTGTDQFDNRPHVPINVSVQQNSYAWSYDYAEDFILFDFKMANIGAFPIKGLYMALYMDGDVGHRSNANAFADDICGFRRTAPMPADYCIDEDTINIAWIADNDGDPVDGGWSYTSSVAVTGMRVVRSPNEDLKYSFNWWVSQGDPTLDFGPRKAGTDDDPFRPFGPHLGTPTGDKNKYYTMRHDEFDYDQLYTAVSHTGEGYLAPPKPDLASDIADGYDTRYLLSFGPFDVQPGDTLPVTVAYIAGDNFHAGPDDFDDYFDAFLPSIFYDKLDFTDLGTNSRWASWIFDNPGVDTDTTDSYGVIYPEGQDDSGKFCWSVTYIDTSIWVVDTIVEPHDSTLVDSLLAVDSTKM
ncbi:MAG: hypothetical protein PHR28_13000, partial [candidate division Zixibacteria bacterium]|nr:hypothetical protein [candidate division Zixibacteria bacterium]